MLKFFGRLEFSRAGIDRPFSGFDFAIWKEKLILTHFASFSIVAKSRAGRKAWSRFTRIDTAQPSLRNDRLDRPHSIFFRIDATSTLISTRLM
jgi:hypothetical protein